MNPDDHLIVAFLLFLRNRLNEAYCEDLYLRARDIVLGQSKETFDQLLSPELKVIIQAMKEQLEQTPSGMAATQRNVLFENGLREINNRHVDSIPRKTL
jgi:hypothetical protein